MNVACISQQTQKANKLIQIKKKNIYFNQKDAVLEQQKMTNH